MELNVAKIGDPLSFKRLNISKRKVSKTNSECDAGVCCLQLPQNLVQFPITFHKIHGISQIRHFWLGAFWKGYVYVLDESELIGEED